MSKIVVLLDGDIIAFQAIVASFHEVELVDDAGQTFIHYMTDFDNAYRMAHASIEQIRKECNANEIVFCWTDYTANWRLDVLPTYKSHRRKADSIRPCGLIKLKERLAADYEAHCWPRLEADDVMGILATDPDYRPGWKKIIVSEDKDMKTIPAFIYNPEKDYQPWEQSLEDADLWFLSQALGGDLTDGYEGCPGVGQDRGLSLLRAKEGVESYEHTFKSGARKGLTETRWRKIECATPWAALVTHYLKAGLNEEAAIQQARVARILRHEDYDQKTGEVKLWKP